MKARGVSIKRVLSARYPDLSEDDILALIIAGRVKVAGEKIRTPSTLVNGNMPIEIITGKRFVSRGGEKLDYVLQKWAINVRDRVFLDVGCSTGGFTDCLLKRGANLVYALDVGYNQLAYAIRKDQRVRVYERTNIMKAGRLLFEPVPDAAVMDISFRSIQGVTSQILDIVAGTWLLCLVKPQFEWRKPDQGFNGVVRKRTNLCEILIDLLEGLWQEKSYVSDVLKSPIKGRKGNTEFFFLLKKEQLRSREEIKTLIEKSVYE